MSRILFLLTLAALTGDCIGNDKSSDTGEAQYVEPGQKAASTPAPVSWRKRPGSPRQSRSRGMGARPCSA
jgi:hypothetical protein